MDSPTCATCHRPRVACVCDRIVSYPTRLRVLLLQHPQEQDAILGSAQIVVATLPAAKIVVGLSWRNLGHALGEPDVDARRWAVLFPDRDDDPKAGPRGDGEDAEPETALRKGRGRPPLDTESLEGILALDGTWSKAKTLWWRNPWLAKLPRLALRPKQPSAYGRLRVEPRRDYVSTLESVGAALTLAGEPPEVEASLNRAMRTLVQRVRDAHIIPPPAGHSRKARLARAARAKPSADEPKGEPE